MVGVFEASSLPDEAVFKWLRERLPISVRNIVLCMAQNSSIAGRIQIVARSIETACHKLFELGFDLKRIQSGEGIAPIPLDASSDLEAMGNTNDAILYASQSQTDRRHRRCRDRSAGATNPKLQLAPIRALVCRNCSANSGAIFIKSTRFSSPRPKSLCKAREPVSPEHLVASHRSLCPRREGLGVSGEAYDLERYVE